jgi:hypothetical protein
LCPQGLAIKHRIYKIGVTDAACILCGKDETIEHVILEMLVYQSILAIVFSLIITSSLAHCCGKLPTWF